MKEVNWTEEDERTAADQGWCLRPSAFLDEDVITIQRIDDPEAWGLLYEHPRFQDDNHAMAYVRGRAEAGCPLAIKALKVSDHEYRCVGRVEEWTDMGPSRTHP